MFDFKNILQRVSGRVRRFRKRIPIFTNLPSVTLPSDRSADTDPHLLGPHFSISMDFFLHKSVVKILRKGNAIRVVMHESVLKPDKFNPEFTRLMNVFRFYPEGVRKILDYVEAATGETFFFLDISDGGGNHESGISVNSNFYAFCRRKRKVEIGLIPDPFNLNDLSRDVQFTEYRDRDEARSAYEQRKALIFWRGSTTGRLNTRNILDNPRIKFCSDALDFPESIDAKIMNVVQFRNNKRVFKKLLKAGLMVPRVSETEFSNYMATIDLDGNSSAWGGLRKHLRLMHVIKPASDFEMFYHVNQPAETFSSVDHVDDVFRELERDENYANNFETAWQGYEYAHEVRRKIVAGDATVFPAGVE